jgi:SH3-like domain-containing protein
MTPTPMPIGIVTIGNLNVRLGPGTEYGYVGAVYKDNEVIVLGRNSENSWLNIKTPEGKSGWVSAQYIDIQRGRDTLVIIPTPPFSSDTTGSILRQVNFGRALDVIAEDRSVTGQLGPLQEHWYSFIDDDPETVMVLMFRPNVNSVGDNFVGYNIEALLYDQHKIGLEWLPGQPMPTGLSQVAEGLPNIGAGQYPGKDWNGLLENGELVWRGGPLVAGVRYYWRIVNRTTETIRYCLIPGEVRDWVCP